MYIRKFKQDPKTLLEQGKQIVQSDADSKYVFRVTLVNLLLGGGKADELAALCGYGESTLLSWLRRVDEEGWESIRAKKQTGRPSLLNDEQVLIIKRAVEGEPAVHGYDIWDGPSVADYIGKSFGISISVRRCQELLHKIMPPTLSIFRDHPSDRGSYHRVTLGPCLIPN